MSTTEHPLMTVADVAESLGTGERFVRRLVAEKRMRYLKIGTHLRFAREDVDAFILASRREVGTAIDPDDLAARWGLVDVGQVGGSEVSGDGD